MRSKYLTLRIPRNLLPGLGARPDGSLVIPDWTQYVTPSQDRSRDRTRRWRERKRASLVCPSPSPSLPSPIPLSLTPLPSPSNESRGTQSRTPSRPDPPVPLGWESVANFLDGSELLRNKPSLYDWDWWARVEARFADQDFNVIDELCNWQEWLLRHPAVVKKTRDWQKRFWNWLNKGYGGGSWSKPKDQAARDRYWVEMGSRAGASNGRGQVEN